MIDYCNSFSDLPLKFQDKINKFNIFFSNDYANLVKSEGGTYKLLFSDVFVLPIVFKKKYFFKYASLPTEPYELDKSSNMQEFLNECMVFLVNKYKIHWVTSLNTSVFPYCPTDSKSIPFGSLIIDLNQTIDELWNNLNGKHRNVIRKAMANNINIRAGDTSLLDDYIIIDKNMSIKNEINPKNMKFLTNQLNILKTNAKVYIAYNEKNEPQAGAIIFYNTYSCYYMYGASILSPQIGSSNLLLWEVIKEMKANNVRYFNFVGYRFEVENDSKFKGIQRFKERFGGSLVKGKLFRFENSRVMYRLYSLLLQIRSKSILKKHRDIVDQEIHKWK